MPKNIKEMNEQLLNPCLYVSYCIIMNFDNEEIDSLLLGNDFEDVLATVLKIIKQQVYNVKNN